jgi:hypothetical protein
LLLGGGASLGRDLGGEPPLMVANLVARNRPEPTTETSLGPLGMEVLDVRSHRDEDLLDDVRRVVKTQARPPTPLKDRWAVQFHESFPGRPVVGHHSGHEAG